MLKNICTADQKDQRKVPFLHEGNGGGETELQPIRKIKIVAFHCHLTLKLFFSQRRTYRDKCVNYMCYP